MSSPYPALSRHMADRTFSIKNTLTVSPTELSPLYSLRQQLCGGGSFKNSKQDQPPNQHLVSLSWNSTLVVPNQVVVPNQFHTCFTSTLCFIFCACQLPSIRSTARYPPLRKHTQIQLPSRQTLWKAFTFSASPLASFIAGTLVFRCINQPSARIENTPVCCFESCRSCCQLLLLLLSSLCPLIVFSLDAFTHSNGTFFSPLSFP